jgi:two-component system cell cycle response regulator
VAQQAKQSNALHGIPLIAVTAFARTSDRAEAFAAGFDGYLAKPIDPEAFVHQLEAFLSPEMRLPSPAPARPTTNPPVKTDANGRTILVVDDLQANLDMLASLLEYSGYKAVTARNPKDALRLAQQIRPALILSDVCMSEASGYDLIREIKNDCRLSAIPFVFTTSTATTEKERKYGLALGAAKFLFRPVEPQQLLREIEECLGAKEKP